MLVGESYVVKGVNSQPVHICRHLDSVRKWWVNAGQV